MCKIFIMVKKKSDIKELRKKTGIFFGLVVVFFLVDVFAVSLAAKLIAELAYFGFAITTLVYSIKLIKRNDLGFGITFLVLSVIPILLIIFAFLLGVLIGISQAGLY